MNDDERIEAPPVSDPREPIITRLAERLGVEPAAILGDGQTPPQIMVDLALPGCGWRHTIMHRWDTPRMAMVEVNTDGTVTYLGDSPETWEPAITASADDLVAALNAAAADLERIIEAGTDEQ